MSTPSLSKNCKPLSCHYMGNTWATSSPWIIPFSPRTNATTPDVAFGLYLHQHQWFLVAVVVVVGTVVQHCLEAIFCCNNRRLLPTLERQRSTGYRQCCITVPTTTNHWCRCGYKPKHYIWCGENGIIWGELVAQAFPM